MERGIKHRWQKRTTTTSAKTKISVGVHQETRKTDGRTRKDCLLTHTGFQCVTVAKAFQGKRGVENAVRGGRHDLAITNKQSGELETRIQTLVGEKASECKRENEESWGFRQTPTSIFSLSRFTVTGTSFFCFFSIHILKFIFRRIVDLFFEDNPSLSCFSSIDMTINLWTNDLLKA